MKTESWHETRSDMHSMWQSPFRQFDLEKWFGRAKECKLSSNSQCARPRTAFFALNHRPVCLFGHSPSRVTASESGGSSYLNQQVVRSKRYLLLSTSFNCHHQFLSVLDCSSEKRVLRCRRYPFRMPVPDQHPLARTFNLE